MPINVNAKNDAINDGVWVEYSGSQFLVTHSSNLRFQRLFNRLHAPHRAKIEKGTLDPAISREIVCKSFSQAIIIDWKDVTDEQGNDVAYSSDMAYEALKNNPDLFEFIQEVSTNLANFKSEELADLGKSSEPI